MESVDDIRPSGNQLSLHRGPGIGDLDPDRHPIPLHLSVKARIYLQLDRPRRSLHHLRKPQEKNEQHQKSLPKTRLYAFVQNRLLPAEPRFILSTHRRSLLQHRVISAAETARPD